MLTLRETVFVKSAERLAQANPLSWVLRHQLGKLRMLQRHHKQIGVNWLIVHWKTNTEKMFVIQMTGMRKMWITHTTNAQEPGYVISPCHLCVPQRRQQVYMKGVAGIQQKREWLSFLKLFAVTTSCCQRHIDRAPIIFANNLKQVANKLPCGKRGATETPEPAQVSKKNS